MQIPRRQLIQGLTAASAGTLLKGCNAEDTAAEISTLNSLLSAEYNIIAAYTAGAGILNNAGATTFLQVAGRFLQQHQEHAAALAREIRSRSGTPIDQSSASFVPPSGFTPTVLNVLRLAANAEKALALAHAAAIASLTRSTHRYLVSSIEGDETQHFMVLYVLLRGSAALSDDINVIIERVLSDVVPRSFVSDPDDQYVGLRTLDDFAVDK